MDTKIMVIDSDPVELQQLHAELSIAFNALICSRFDKAFELFCLFRPSAVLIGMTRFRDQANGFVRRVRSLPDDRVPVIALAQMTTIAQVIDGLNSGFDLVYSKPCPPERIRGKLLELMAKPALSERVKPVQI